MPVALVTGANAGIGWAIAQRLQQDGFAIAFHTRDDKEESRAQFEKIARGGPAVWVRADLGELDNGEPLVAEAFERFGGLDVLVNNAGIAQTDLRDSWNTSEDTWDRVIRINLRSVYVCSKAAIPVMLERERASDHPERSFG